MSTGGTRIKLSRWARQNGVSYRTALRMFHRGELQAHQLKTGTILVEQEPGIRAEIREIKKTLSEIKEILLGPKA